MAAHNCVAIFFDCGSREVWSFASELGSFFAFCGGMVVIFRMW